MSLLREQQAQFTVMISHLIDYATVHGFTLRQGDAWRSTDKLKCPSCEKGHSYQELLVFNGRSTTLNSRHADRLAQDFIVERLTGEAVTTEEWEAIGKFWESQGPGTVWGGRWTTLNDRQHFELTPN